MVSQLATLLPTKDISYIGLVWNCTISSIISKRLGKGKKNKGDNYRCNFEISAGEVSIISSTNFAQT